MRSSELQHVVRDLIEPTVERLGFEVVAIELLSGPKRPVLRVSIDGPHGIGADDCGLVSTRISPLLDTADPVPGAYDLEVSSPGMDRPLQRIQDFERFTGFRARIRLQEGLPRRRYTGELKGVEGSDVLIEVDGELHRVSVDAVEIANLKLSLDEYQRLAPASLSRGDEDPAVAPSEGPSTE